MDIPTPADAGLSEKFKDWRRYQEDVIKQILDSPKKYFVLEAPTGAGKSAIGIAVSNLLQNKFGQQAKVFYVASTKQLQGQLLEDFPEAKMVKGRGNFPCLLIDEVTAEDCVYESIGKGAKNCPLYDTCPYFVQRDEAVEARLSVHNYAYYLNVQMRTKLFNSCDLLILDEAHLAENSLMGFVSFRFPMKDFMLMDVPFPADNREATVDILDQALPAIKEEIRTLRQQLTDDKAFSNPEDVSMLKKYRSLQDKIDRFFNTYEKNWLFSHQVDKEKGWKSYVEFRPVWVNKFGSIFWKPVEEGGKILLMSATIGNVDMFCNLLGVPREEVEFISLPSTFPRENRLVIIEPVGKLSMKNYDGNMQAMVAEIDEIIERHEGEKGLIHTISYKIAHDILSCSAYKARMVAPNSEDDKGFALQQFIDSDEPRILVSPAFGIGINLEGDAARWQIIVKVPFASLGDEQIRMRLRDNNAWYTYDAANRCVQASGRIVRSEEDFGVTYLLDSNFLWFFQRNPSAFPKWFKEAVVRK
jgi:Rad3-related DNA helicase